MKNENYEFIDEEHLPNIEKMRAAALAAKDPGPWIIDPLYGFLMDKNCEPIELWSEEGHGNENLEFIEACNPRSVAYMVSQRDELLAALKLSRNELHSCQAVIHLCGGFDPAYVKDAQAALKVMDTAIAKCEAK